MLSDPVAEAFGLIHRHPSGENFFRVTILFPSSLFIGRLRPGGHRRAPLFDLALWNMYDQTIGDLPRTNNAAEGWH